MGDKTGCCQSCKASCAEGFKKVVDLQYSGLVIYLHTKKDEKKKSTSKNDDYCYVLHNTGSRELKRTEYVSELHKYQTKCTQCKTIIQRVRSLLDEIKAIRENDIIGVCEHCKQATHRKIPCKRCDFIVSKFIDLHRKKCSEREQRFKVWVCKVKHLLQALIDSDAVCQHKEFKDTELERILRELKGPLSMRVPDENFFPSLNLDKLTSLKSLSQSKEMLEDLLFKIKHATDKRHSDDSLYPSPSTTCRCKYGQFDERCPILRNEMAKITGDLEPKKELSKDVRQLLKQEIYKNFIKRLLELSSALPQRWHQGKEIIQALLVTLNYAINQELSKDVIYKILEQLRELKNVVVTQGLTKHLKGEVIMGITSDFADLLALDSSRNLDKNLVQLLTDLTEMLADELSKNVSNEKSQLLLKSVQEEIAQKLFKGKDLDQVLSKKNDAAVLEHLRIGAKQTILSKRAPSISDKVSPRETAEGSTRGFFKVSPSDSSQGSGKVSPLDLSKRVPKDTAKQTRPTKELTQASHKGTLKDLKQIAAKTLPNDSMRGAAKRPLKDSVDREAKGPPTDSTKDSSRGPLRDSTKDSPRGLPKDSTKISPKGIAKDSTHGAAKGFKKDPMHGAPKQIAKDTEQTLGKGKSKDVSKSEPKGTKKGSLPEKDSRQVSPTGAPKDATQVSTKEKKQVLAKAPKTEPVHGKRPSRDTSQATRGQQKDKEQGPAKAPKEIKQKLDKTLSKDADKETKQKLGKALSKDADKETKQKFGKALSKDADKETKQKLDKALSKDADKETKQKLDKALSKDADKENKQKLGKALSKDGDKENKQKLDKAHSKDADKETKKPKQELVKEPTEEPRQKHKKADKHLMLGAAKAPPKQPKDKTKEQSAEKSDDKSSETPTTDDKAKGKKESSKEVPLPVAKELNKVLVNKLKELKDEYVDKGVLNQGCLQEINAVLKKTVQSCPPDMNAKVVNALANLCDAAIENDSKPEDDEVIKNMLKDCLKALTHDNQNKKDMKSLISYFDKALIKRAKDKEKGQRSPREKSPRTSLIQEALNKRRIQDELKDQNIDDAGPKSGDVKKKTKQEKHKPSHHHHRHHHHHHRHHHHHHRHHHKHHHHHHRKDNKKENLSPKKQGEASKKKEEKPKTPPYRVPRRRRDSTEVLIRLLITEKEREEHLLMRRKELELERERERLEMQKLALLGKSAGDQALLQTTEIMTEKLSADILVCPTYKGQSKYMVSGEEIAHLDPCYKDDIDMQAQPLLFKSRHEFPDAEMLDVTKRRPRLETSLEFKERCADRTIRYRLSNKDFIEKGWTQLPTKKIMRRMNIYKMEPANPKFDWFERHKADKELFYDTGARLADIDENGRGHWYYRNGAIALDYHNAEESHIGQRYVVYSSGLESETGRAKPITVLGLFDVLGNGVVYDLCGNVRLKYNQSEGLLVDPKLGPPGRWKWHTLNDPPVLQQVFVNNRMHEPDLHLVQKPKHTEDADDFVKQTQQEMLSIELDNFLKEKATKLLQKFKPFQIRMKAVKLNEHFSLKILDQANIHLIFRDGPTTLKINLGMLLKSDEIIDTETSEMADVATPYDMKPAKSASGSVENIHKILRSVQNKMRPNPNLAMKVTG
ncbi:unnamed protein product [Chrysodeixis includens]|uniref:Uncharacterized protein n=1 Tax=Chrysodeixis includens TaxID=689277 RepID=A0A9P0BG84_CHRIL|nr:unnamed protein product [Chrysodeixis includens]